MQNTLKTGIASQNNNDILSKFKREDSNVESRSTIYSYRALADLATGESCHLLAKIDEDVLQRCLSVSDTFGYVLIPMKESIFFEGDLKPNGVEYTKAERDAAHADKNVVTEFNIVVLAQVARINNALALGVRTNEDSEYNAILTFYTSKRLREAGIGARELTSSVSADSENYGFSNIPRMHRALIEHSEDIKTLGIPMFNTFDGYPKGVHLVDGRVGYYGFNSNRVVFSYPGLEFGTSIFMPPQLRLGRHALQYILSQNYGTEWNPIGNNREERETDTRRTAEEADTYLPSTVDTIDYIYWYRFQTSLHSRIPIHQSFFLGGGSQLLWMSSHRDLLFGTSKEEFFARTVDGGPIGPENVSWRNFQSARGSGSSLVERGDYAVFFVGQDKRTIYYASYSRNRDGLKTTNASYWGGERIDEDIRDISWDINKKALWVLYGKKGLALFHLSEEYDLMGWSYYSLGGDFNSIKNLVRDERTGNVSLIVENDAPIYRHGSDVLTEKYLFLYNLSNKVRKDDIINDNDSEAGNIAIVSGKYLTWEQQRSIYMKQNRYSLGYHLSREPVRPCCGKREWERQPSTVEMCPTWNYQKLVTKDMKIQTVQYNK